jgi:uncharacterized protein YhbP (UPF0306 family)
VKQLSVSFGHPEYPDDALRESIVGILDRHQTLAMATVMEDRSYINTAHYGYSSALDLFILTPPFTQHSRNAEANPSVAVAVWNEPQVWGADLQGAQMFGVWEGVQPAGMAVAMDALASHIPEFGEAFRRPQDLDGTESKLYAIRIFHVKLLDEPRFGRQNHLSLNVFGK